jgi:hypothetical protein
MAQRKLPRAKGSLMAAWRFLRGEFTGAILGVIEHFVEHFLLS